MKIKMDFICDQDWNNLQDTDCGKFCGQCNKTIIDFTSSSTSKIAKELELNSELCGLYKVEQVDSDVITPIKSIFTSPLFVYLTSAFLMLHPRITLAQNKTTNKVEKVEQNAETIPSDSTQIVATKKPKKETTENCSNTKVKKNNHGQLYFTKRFPFITYRRRTMMGKSIRTF